MKITTSRLRKIIRQVIVEAYEKTEYDEGTPNWDNEEKLRKAGKFDKSNISKADEEQTAAELKYRESLRKEYERKAAEIEKMRQDRNARKKGERYRYDKEDLDDFIQEAKRKLIKESSMEQSYQYASQLLEDAILELAEQFSDGQLGDGAHDAKMNGDTALYELLTQAAIAARER